MHEIGACDRGFGVQGNRQCVRSVFRVCQADKRKPVCFRSSFFSRCAAEQDAAGDPCCGLFQGQQVIQTVFAYSGQSCSAVAECDAASVGNSCPGHDKAGDSADNSGSDSNSLRAGRNSSLHCQGP
ncbi:MAG: hypothetical protein GY820_43920, partial [Gammaproteobacteria bacterium]|nr:hypothetical protein [Gammaproteobacteria bacterium]